MLLSQTSKYTLRAAIYLAERGEEETVAVPQVAAALDVPRNYLSKILHQLAQAGVLVSERGPHGGFRLAPGARDLSLAQILAPVDPFGDRRCLLGRSKCNDTDPCPLHDRWTELADGIERLLQETTLADLVARNEQGSPK